MSEDASPDQSRNDESSSRVRQTRKRFEEGADKAVEQFDEGIVDILSWILDTETRARIYVYLRQEPWSTSEEIAEGTGLYPSTVRESLAELAEEEKLIRRKRKSEGAGNNPYEYKAIPPSELVSEMVGEIQSELNALCKLDRSGSETESSEPVHIEVNSDTNQKQ
ncbi:MAG: ArsR family transcriptional regulator [Halobacteriaceae archaeon]